MKKVITYGTFDLFHEGHYRLLERAKALGDYLIVGVTTEHFDEARGKVNVVDSIMERIENVRKTGFADEIIIEDHEGQKIEDIQKYGVDIFTVGSDWIGNFDYLKQFCQVVYLERTPDISSSMLRKINFRLLMWVLWEQGVLFRDLLQRQSMLVVSISDVPITRRLSTPMPGTTDTTFQTTTIHTRIFWIRWMLSILHLPMKPTTNMQNRLWKVENMSM